jgi:hypothetical protein
MQSRAITADEYLAELPDDRRATVSAIRDVIDANLPDGYEAGMQYGMLSWYVPHSVYPPGYHTDRTQPLPYLALASQKQHLSLYVFGCYLGGDDSGDAQWFRDAWTAAGKKLDMGKSCVRFKRLDDVPLEVVADAVRRLPVEVLIERYEANLPASKRPR